VRRRDREKKRKREKKRERKKERKKERERERELCLSSSDKAQPSAPGLMCAFWLVDTCTAVVSARNWSLARAFAAFRGLSPLVLFSFVESLSLPLVLSRLLFITSYLLCRLSGCRLYEVALCPLPPTCGPANYCLSGVSPSTCATLGSNTSLFPADHTVYIYIFIYLYICIYIIH
jgi:hypothetical protein